MVVDRDPSELEGLRHVLVGGDVLSADHVRRLLASGVADEVVHCYGPTESTLFATIDVIREVPSDETALPIGRPIANTTCHVVDDRLRPVPVGEQGELLIGGLGLAEGYVNRPELTAEKFVPDPFAPPDSGECLYRTGDLARWREDGRLEFGGRIDHQLKIRGYRIEPGEIEAVLRDHDEIEDCVVVAREDGAGRRRLVAYLTGPVEPDIPGLRAFVGERLPAYMVPAAWVVLEALPLTQNNKVYRAPIAGRRWSATTSSIGLRSSGPRINHPAMSSRAGSPICSARSCGSRASAAMTASSSWAATPCSSPRCSRASASRPASGSRSTSWSTRRRPRRSRGRSSALGREPPSTPFRLWFPRRGRPRRRSRSRRSRSASSTTSTRPPSLTSSRRSSGCTGSSTSPRWSGRWWRSSRATRSTGPRSPAGTEGWVAEIHEPFPIELDPKDLSDAPDPDATLAALADAQFRQRLPIDELPLVRWRSRQARPTGHALLHQEHHLVHDGWSMMVLLRELRDLYAARAKAGFGPAAMTLQFRDFAAWQRGLLERRSRTSSSPTGGSGSRIRRSRWSCPTTTPGLPARPSAATRWYSTCPPGLGERLREFGRAQASPPS